ncbi:hypothetical protein D9756_008359 [Leucocoprinus leucothites]|uniref:F-box domain-containing protein n=1 Tax=Leucocoprinus leucothites TaxID=201217 RepID=A0A8H5CZQ4_9AGAR|nr:hypothetical protein D9756_008359 [Leucoagaricus leucothites]
MQCCFDTGYSSLFSLLLTLSLVYSINPPSLGIPSTEMAPRVRSTYPKIHQHPTSNLAKRSSTTLFSLPSEILLDICTHLDHFSLLSMRLCCKILCQVTNTRHIWYRLTRRLCEEYNIEPPEEPLDRYTSKELENWYLRRSLAQDAWQTPKRSRYDSRIVDLRVPNVNEPHLALHYLLPGDSATPQPQFLFDPTKNDPAISKEREVIKYSLWNDRSRMGAFFRVAGTVVNHRKPRTFIYDLELSGHAASSVLVSTGNARFQKPPRALVSRKTALNEQYFVEVCTHPEQIVVGEAIVVYRYNDARGCTLDYVLEPITQIPFRDQSVLLVEFIHDNKIADSTRLLVLSSCYMQYRSLTILRRTSDGPRAYPTW